MESKARKNRIPLYCSNKIRYQISSAFGNVQFPRHWQYGSIRVNTAFNLQEVIDGFPRIKHNDRTSKDGHMNHATYSELVTGCKFKMRLTKSFPPCSECKPLMRSGHLKRISQEWKPLRPRWEGVATTLGGKPRHKHGDHT